VSTKPSAYAQRMREQYRAAIAMARAWRDAYVQLRRIGWDRSAAAELANLTVGAPA
jgi:phosphoglycerate dehydrogenase-like enzyme